MGDAIDVVLKATNTSQDVRTLSGRLALSTMYYTGVHYRNVNSISIDDKILGKGESMLTYKMLIYLFTRLEQNWDIIRAPADQATDESAPLPTNF